MPSAAARCATAPSSTVPTPRPCQASATSNATSALPGRSRTYKRVTDDVLGVPGERDDARGGRRERGGLPQVRPAREEPQQARAAATGRRASRPAPARPACGRGGSGPWCRRRGRRRRRAQTPPAARSHVQRGDDPDRSAVLDDEHVGDVVGGHQLHHAVQRSPAARP